MIIAAGCQLTPTTVIHQTTTAPTADAIVQAVFDLLTGSLKDTADVNYNITLNAFIILPKQSTILEEALAAKNGDSEALKSWNAYIDSIKVLSESVQKLHAGYRISVNNLDNPDEAILIIKDGVIEYNIAAGS
jgi:hypothetical protein